MGILVVSVGKSFCKAMKNTFILGMPDSQVTANHSFYFVSRFNTEWGGSVRMFAYISKTLKKRHSLHNPSLNMKFTLIFSTAFLASISFVNGVPVKAAVPAGLEVGFIVFNGKNILTSVSDQTWKSAQCRPCGPHRLRPWKQGELAGVSEKD